MNYINLLFEVNALEHAKWHSSARKVPLSVKENIHQSRLSRYESRHKALNRCSKKKICFLCVITAKMCIFASGNNANR